MFPWLLTAFNDVVGSVHVPSGYRQTFAMDPCFIPGLPSLSEVYPGYGQGGRCAFLERTSGLKAEDLFGGLYVNDHLNPFAMIERDATGAGIVSRAGRA